MSDSGPLAKDTSGAGDVHKEYQSLALAAANAARAVTVSPAIREMLKSIEHNNELIKRAFGPLAELRRAGIFDVNSPLHREMERVRRFMADTDARFRLPEMGEVARLMEDFRAGPLSKALKRYAEEESGLRQAMERMSAPWLDVQENLRSVASFAELQGIGHALRSMPAFSEKFASALRLDLGDWRDSITWRPEVLADLGARSNFYADLGFNRALTEFPEPAFQQGLEIAGLRREPPPISDLYGAPVPRFADEQAERGLERTNTAHDWLFRLETRLRAFIDDVMTQTFGANWPRHRLPNGVYEKWQDKKQKAEHAGRPVRPLVAYADFTDYELVICRADNWRDVFAGYFGRSESVRETFQRLYSIRLDTMHARPITQDDELLLHVEARRLIRVILPND